VNIEPHLMPFRVTTGVAGDAGRHRERYGTASAAAPSSKRRCHLVVVSPGSGAESVSDMSDAGAVPTRLVKGRRFIRGGGG